MAKHNSVCIHTYVYFFFIKQKKIIKLVNEKSIIIKEEESDFLIFS